MVRRSPFERTEKTPCSDVVLKLMQMRDDEVDYNEDVEKSFIAKKSGEGLVEIEVTFPGSGCGPDTSALVVNRVIDSGASRSLVSSELVKRLRKLNAGSISTAGES